MDVEQKIKDILEPIIPDVKQDVYTGTKTLYIVFNYADDRCVLYANNEPQIDVAYMQIHLFAPMNPTILRKKIRAALFKGGFTYPQVTPLYEKDTKTYHTIFECSITGAPEL